MTCSFCSFLRKMSRQVTNIAVFNASVQNRTLVRKMKTKTRTMRMRR